MRVSAQRCSQRSRYACASSRLSKRIPLSGVFCVSDPRFDFPFAIRIVDPARQCHHAIVGEHIPKQRVDGGIVDIRDQHAFFQIVEDHNPGTTTESTKRFLMEFGPGVCTRTPHQQADGFSAVAESQYEQPRPAIFATLRVTHHRPTAVIDLGFFSCCGEDDARRFWPLRSSKLANKTLHGLIAARKAVVGDQVLPDGHGIPAPRQSLLDQPAIRFAGTGGRLWMGR
jgi:hypothetical protein